MQGKENKPDEKKGWMKATLGLALLSWNIFSKKKPNEKAKENMGENDKFHQNDGKTIVMNTSAKEYDKATKEYIEEKRLEAENVRKASENKEANGWTKALPEKLPEPTYWPFFLAMGLAFIFWGILTSWIIILVGLFLFIVSLAGWINILRHE